MSLSTPSPVSAPADGTGDGDRTESVAAALALSRLFNDYRSAFEVATGLQLALIARHPRESVRSRPKKEPFANALTYVLDESTGERVSALPVRLGDVTVAWLRIGPFLASDNGHASSAHRSRSAHPLPRLAPPAHRSVLRLLRVFTLHLSAASNDLILDLHRAEPPFVQAARTFIEVHLTEDLSLTAVAAAVNISPYYFCKRFHESTGVHFTEYVNRARISRVKERLLNPHVHVSEAAYEAGFQSLSQFNRAFRRVTGESPSHYRHRLHANAAPPSTSRRSHAA
jgi:AraC-like DNA-binding protein